MGERDAFSPLSVCCVRMEVMNVVTDAAKIEEALTRGVAEVMVREHLEAAMRSGKQLRVKFGIDPTAPDLHLGHTVPLRKLRQFQELGHTAILLIGDFTAKIGDPAGRSQERKPLTDREVKANMKRYLSQAGKVVDAERAEIVYNSSWFDKEGLSEAIELTRAATFQQVMHRADFKKRFEAGDDITLTEILYPILQGYDSVKVRADVELGGTDQTFNLFMGRRVQRHFKMGEQDVITVPLLEGTDGVHKMSKSFGNTIALDDAPDVMFGKIMAIPDQLIGRYYEFLTDAEDIVSDPREGKLKLAEIIVDMYHGGGAGVRARNEFTRVFAEKGKPSDIPTVSVGASEMPLADLLVAVKLAASKNEARRLIEQGGVYVNDARTTDPHEVIAVADTLIQVGPRRFVRVRQ